MPGSVRSWASDTLSLFSQNTEESPGFPGMQQKRKRENKEEGFPSRDNAGPLTSVCLF